MATCKRCGQWKSNKPDTPNTRFTCIDCLRRLGVLWPAPDRIKIKKTIGR